MRFTNIDGQELDELQMSVICDFFQEHIFFKFMDRGRPGLIAGTQDLVDTCLFRAEKYAVKKHNKKPAKLDDREFYEELFRDAQRRIVDGFIKGGSAGMRIAIFEVATNPSIYN